MDSMYASTVMKLQTNWQRMAPKTDVKLFLRFRNYLSIESYQAIYIDLNLSPTVDITRVASKLFFLLTVIGISNCSLSVNLCHKKNLLLRTERYMTEVSNRQLQSNVLWPSMF